MSSRRSLASWWVAPFRIATALSPEEAQTAIAQVVDVSSPKLHIMGTAFYNTLEQNPSTHRFRVRTNAPFLSGRNIMLPVAEGCIVPSTTGSIVEVQFRPRIIDVVILLVLVFIPGLVDRQALWAGPIMAVGLVAVCSIYLIGPEVDALRATLIRALSGKLIAASE